MLPYHTVLVPVADAQTWSRKRAQSQERLVACHDGYLAIFLKYCLGAGGRNSHLYSVCTVSLSPVYEVSVMIITPFQGQHAFMHYASYIHP